MSKITTITRGTYFTALGLFTVAHEQIAKADACIAELEKLLGVPESDRLSSHFADEAYSRGAASLDEALKRADYVVSETGFNLQQKATAMADALERSDEAKTDPIFNDAAAVIRELAAAVDRKVEVTSQ
jgi:hypothetical protein